MRVIICFVLGAAMHAVCATEIKYYSTTIDDSIILCSLNQINSTEVTYTKVSLEKHANLIIERKNNLSIQTRYGESNRRFIFINGQIKLTPRETVNLITHEIGHYLFLDHNNNPHSIMNDNISLNEKYVTNQDITNLTHLKYRVALANALSNIKYFMDNLYIN